MLSRLRTRVTRRFLRLALLAQAAAQHRAEPPDLSGTEDVETQFGSLYLPGGDAFIAPYLREHGIGPRRNKRRRTVGRLIGLSRTNCLRPRREDVPLLDLAPSH